MQRIVLVIPVLLAFGMLPSSAIGREDPPKKLTDEQISKLLVGKWAAEEGGEKGPKVKGTTYYKKDGTYEAEGKITNGEKSLSITFSGTWKVVDGMIVGRMTKSYIPELLKEGKVYKDQVLSIDDKILKFKTEDGKESVRKRIKE